jgi:hypothetical protein
MLYVWSASAQQHSISKVFSKTQYDFSIALLLAPPQCSGMATFLILAIDEIQHVLRVSLTPCQGNGDPSQELLPSSPEVTGQTKMMDFTRFHGMEFAGSSKWMDG